MEVPWSEIDVALLDRLAVHRLEDGKRGASVEDVDELARVRRVPVNHDGDDRRHSGGQLLEEPDQGLHPSRRGSDRHDIATEPRGIMGSSRVPGGAESARAGAPPAGLAGSFDT
jgi:hypothetical protein